MSVELGKTVQSPELIAELSSKAAEIRRSIVKMITAAKSGHPGGSLSAADILAVLYFHTMRHDPKNPTWENRDRFIISKGHAGPVLYSTLAEAGYFPKDELMTFRKLNSRIQGHPDMKKIPGIDFSTGSLGQGMPVGVGMALAGKLDEKPYRVFVMIGDGESQEGSIWEASMAASHYKLDNLTVILDHNGLQIDGPNDKVMKINPVEDKWKAFGWNVLVIDGHDLEQIIDALDAKNIVPGKPTMIIAKTIKGKGVSFMENEAGWHGKAPKPEELERALADLN